jgi:subtilisin family serine protease
MDPLSLVKLTELMERTSGRPEIKVGLIDGPVALQHPDLPGDRIVAVAGKGGACTRTDSIACSHGTFVAGILAARRPSVAPAICPDCTLLVRPIFAESMPANAGMPSATPEELAQAILDCIDAGARVLNISAGLDHLFPKNERLLGEALDSASRRGIIAVVAAGNQGTLGSTAITRHPWVIPVAGYDLRGRPMNQSNLGISIGRWGLGAPGESVTSLGATGAPLTSGGTSAAAPFVTGAIALLWSEFPNATAAQIKLAVTQTPARRRNTVVPPLLDAWSAYRSMKREGP